MYNLDELKLYYNPETLEYYLGGTIQVAENSGEISNCEPCLNAEIQVPFEFNGEGATEQNVTIPIHAITTPGEYGEPDTYSDEDVFTALIRVGTEVMASRDIRWKDAESRTGNGV